MGKLNYVKPEKIRLKEHPVLNEKWVQDRIAEDPSVLGLGDLVLETLHTGSTKIASSSPSGWGLSVLVYSARRVAHRRQRPVEIQAR